MNEITVHMVVKNEPFIYYAVKAVYDEADEILLYDTGSDDEHTLNDIDKILEEDREGKIKSRRLEIGGGQEMWTDQTLHHYIKNLAGTTGVGIGAVRQMQIEDTRTPFFMIVDGDEVHFRGTINRIKRRVLWKLAGDVVCARIPLLWFCSEDEIFYPKKKRRWYDTMGRVFRTDGVYVNTVGFPEEHYRIGTKTTSGLIGSPYNVIVRLTPFFHYESYLKPWRRTSFPGRERVDIGLPEVMVENPYYMERYRRKNESQRTAG